VILTTFLYLPSQISYKLCGVCNKFILKKQIRLHTKLHEGAADAARKGAEDLDTSREEEEEEEEEEEDPADSQSVQV